ncbi:NUDIX hydrolase [Sinomonas terrae]|uniref:NUDIX domain-containing protein n=1 Tax=Sinomonas terrae TaxID=2908838 RepID=A0ABS9U358_9MICC|nr:NUDIX domain-containing protein [Sinomonas terrae]MCH6471133.1 NUDIX domain-containing protein [Sinomonas terrae]
MPTPDFILALRDMIGVHPLWLPGVKAVVTDDGGRLLLVRRADNGRWTVPAGIIEPGEEPAMTAVREVFEETGVHVRVSHLAGVGTTAPVVYPNGDHAQYLDVVMACDYVGGEACVNDDENLEVRWFEANALPELPPLHRRAIEWALDPTRGAHFVAPAGR